MEFYSDRYTSLNLDCSSDFGEARRGADVVSLHTITHRVEMLRRDMSDIRRPFLGQPGNFLLFFLGIFRDLRHLGKHVARRN